MSSSSNKWLRGVLEIGHFFVIDIFIVRVINNEKFKGIPHNYLIEIFEIVCHFYGVYIIMKLIFLLDDKE